jgi:hypothetical protein
MKDGFLSPVTSALCAGRLNFLDKMITSPVHTICELCDDAALLCFVDAKTGTDHFFCRKHEPPTSIGERSPRWSLNRWRLASDNNISQKLAAPKDSREHRDIYLDLCESGLMGREGACRYYLSMITGIDQFVLWDDEFVSNMQEFVVSKTCPAASVFCPDFHAVQFLAAFMRRAYEQSEGRGHERRVTRAERAVELLLQHPEWSNEEIAAHVPTTLKQLQRWSDFTVLRVRYQRNHRD